jgi:hypothetical protein
MRYLLLLLFFLATLTSSRAIDYYDIDLYGVKSTASPGAWGSNVVVTTRHPVDLWIQPTLTPYEFHLVTTHDAVNIIDQEVRYTIDETWSVFATGSTTLVCNAKESYTNSCSTDTAYLRNDDVLMPKVTYTNFSFATYSENQIAARDIGDFQLLVSDMLKSEIIPVSYSITFSSGTGTESRQASRNVSVVKELTGQNTGSLRYALGGHRFLDLEGYNSDPAYTNSSTLNPLYQRLIDANMNDANYIYTFTWDDVSTIAAGSTAITNAEFVSGGVTNLYNAVELNSSGGVYTYVELNAQISLTNGVMYRCVNDTAGAGIYADYVRDEGVGLEFSIKDPYNLSYTGSRPDKSNTTDYFIGRDDGTQFMFYGGRTKTNTLGQIVALIPERISILATDPKRPVFSVKDDATPNYVRNTNCWVYGLDMTPFSPFNTVPDGYENRAGTLISPRHFIWAGHYGLQGDDGPYMMRFVTADNQVVERNIISATTISGTDIQIGVLDSDVPESIGFCKVLPKDHYRWLPSFGGIPVMWLDRREQAWDSTMKNYASTSIADQSDWHIIGAVTPEISHYALSPMEGDSGNPVVMFIDQEPVVMVCFYFTSGNSGGIVEHYDEINALMTAQGGGYQLTPIDLSALGYPEYEILP